MSSLNSALSGDQDGGLLTLDREELDSGVPSALHDELDADTQQVTQRRPDQDEDSDTQVSARRGELSDGHSITRDFRFIALANEVGFSGLITSQIRKQPPLHSVRGENFEIEEEGGYLFLSHPKWGLTGYGKSLAEAEESLREDARLKSEHYFNLSPDQMSVEALEMRGFMMDFV